MSELSVETVALQGGRLCLDFANTVDWRDREDAIELLDGPGALARWGRRLGLLQAGRIDMHGAPAERELARALELREAIHAAFSAVARGEEPRPEPLDLLRRAQREALAAGRLVRDGDGWHLAWKVDELRSIRLAVAASAWELLTDARALARVGRCAARGCGWLFEDTSRNGRRRWCSMAGCGSREKMRRQYARRRAEH